MELFENVAIMMTGLLFSLIGLAVAALGIKTLCDKNPSGFPELTFGLLIFAFGLDMMKNARRRHEYTLRTSPNVTWIEMTAVGPAVLRPQARSPAAASSLPAAASSSHTAVFRSAASSSHTDVSRSAAPSSLAAAPSSHTPAPSSHTPAPSSHTAVSRSAASNSPAAVSSSHTAVSRSAASRSPAAASSSTSTCFICRMCNTETTAL